MQEPFSTFLFHQKLEEHLSFFIENPEALPNAVVFCGAPGTGKTSFAKLYAETFASNTDYQPMNETKIDKAFKETAALNRTSVSITSLMEEGSSTKFDTIHILDEFHNLSPKEQDFFKTKIDGLRETDRLIVILNTTNSRPVWKMLSSAIYSRLYVIDFDLPLKEATTFAKKVEEEFPLLDIKQIHALLPDMRQIVRNHQMEELKRRLSAF